MALICKTISYQPPLPYNSQNMKPNIKYLKYFVLVHNFWVLVVIHVYILEMNVAILVIFGTMHCVCVQNSIGSGQIMPQLYLNPFLDFIIILENASDTNTGISIGVYMVGWLSCFLLNPLYFKTSCHFQTLVL